MSINSTFVLSFLVFDIKQSSVSVEMTSELTNIINQIQLTTEKRIHIDQFENILNNIIDVNHNFVVTTILVDHFKRIIFVKLKS